MDERRGSTIVSIMKGFLKMKVGLEGSCSAWLGIHDLTSSIVSRIVLLAAMDLYSCFK